MTDFAAIAAQVRHDLCRHQIGEREHILVDLILRLSLDMGRTFARIPRLEDFTACVGISKGNVSALLEGLVNSRILSIERDTHRVLPRGASHEWQVRPRKTIAEQERALALLRAMQAIEQPDLLPRDQSLTEAVAELAVETASVPESGTSTFPNQEPKFPDREQKFPIREPTGEPSNIRYTYNVVRPKRRTLTSEAGNGETSNGEALRERVRQFVGESDWTRFWNRPSYDHLWTDDGCLKALERALRYVQAGLKDGVKVKRTKGAMLWDQFNRERSNLRT